MSDLNRWDYNTYSGYLEWYEDPQGSFVLYDEVKELQAQVERAFKAGYAINILDAQTSDPDLLFKDWKAKAEGGES